MNFPAFKRRDYRALGRIQAKFKRSRPGSVLILVVALLVLMALIGTAFISTARIDRYSSTQNTYNTEVDLLVQGVLNMAQGPMLSKVQATTKGVPAYRQATSATNYPAPAVPPAPPAIAPYYPFESPTTDLYLASRVPTLPLNSSTPTWAYITAPALGTVFEAPYAVDAGSGSALGTLPVQYTARTNAIPTSISVPQADGSLKLFPGLNITDPNVNGGRPAIVLAADTDGDGIADAGYVRLPMGQIEGATYYGAVRIIDNAAAINTAVAVEANPDTAGGRAVPGDFSPVNLDFKGLLISGENLSVLNQYRFNNGLGGNGDGEAYSPNPVGDTVPLSPHPELVFNTPYEAFWTQLASRLNNPGYNTSSVKYQAVPISEALPLAYHFCLANPNGSASAVLETDLPVTTGSTSLRIAPFAPNNTANWYNQVFNYNLTGTTNIPLRPILVVRNPVSNFVPSYFNDLGAYPGTLNGTAVASYSFGDRVQFPDPYTGSPRGFVCVQPNAPSPNTAPILPTGYNTAYWGPMPWTNHPTKINVNTGTFDQLWTAYWSVMLDHADGNGAYPAGPGQIVDAPAPGSQFRNPVRSGNVVLTNQGVTQLRAAEAAINTIDMRDGDDDVSSRTIFVPANNGLVQVNVYGSEKQPYITEVMVAYEPDNAGPTGIIPAWVAVEIYNPHPTAIPLNNWKLCSLDRGLMKLKEVGDFTKSLAGYTHPSGQQGAWIEPGERIVLQSNDGMKPKSVAIAWATPPVVKPIICQASTAGGASLDTAVPNELVLLRPRRADGTPTASTDPQNTFNEGTLSSPILSDFVPLDSIDMVGIPPPPPPPATPTAKRYRYARANLIAQSNDSAAWHCVYPGPYNTSGFPALGNAPAKPFHMWGICEVNATTTPDNGNFGQPKGKFPQAGQPSVDKGPSQYTFATYETRPLQINNRDSAGPNKVYDDITSPPPPGAVSITKTAMSFPYGGFARDGDILQVPFIGGYKVFDNKGNLAELNSVTIDSVYAQFLDPATLPSDPAYQADMDSSFGVPFHNEQIGHFCPMDIGSQDFADDPSAMNPGKWTYHWAKRLFDYVSVSTPQDAYLPNVDPSIYFTAQGPYSGDPTLNQGTPATNSPKYPNTVPPPQAIPTAQGATVTNRNPNPNLDTNQQLQGLQDAAAVEGRLNINSVDWKALSAVPFYTPGETGPTYIQQNAAMAQAIVQFRENTATSGHAAPGPFRSIFDLMQVPQFKALNNTWAAVPGQTDNPHGDLSPFSPTLPKGQAGIPETDSFDHVFGDVKTRFIALQRISNLITTRSDSFTAYAQVQGWQNVGTPFPNLVATRRAAALLDRSQVLPVRNAAAKTVNLAPMGVINVPND